MQSPGWRSYLPESVRQYTEAAPIAALLLGISSGAPYAMIAATLTTRLAQDGITKSSITAFSLRVLGLQPQVAMGLGRGRRSFAVIGRLGQRVSWLLFAGVLAIAAIVNLGLADPTTSLTATAVAAILVAVAGSHLRHRHRRVSNRIARAATARRRLRHVAIRMAHRLRRCGVARARNRRACRLARRVYRMRSVRAPRDGCRSHLR